MDTSSLGRSRSKSILHVQLLIIVIGCASVAVTGDKLIDDDHSSVKKVHDPIGLALRAAAGEDVGAGPELEELSCETSCVCHTRSTTLKTEYRVICNRTLANKPALLSSNVFASQGPPSFDLKAYVRVEDVRGLIISQDFMSRWTAHSSCAFDAWRAGTVVFPEGPIPEAPTDAYLKSFIGLGIKNSSLGDIPSNIFSEFSSFGIDLYNVSVPIINLYDILGDTTERGFQYIKIKKSTVGTIKGPRTTEGSPNKIKLATELGVTTFKGVLIENSLIGSVEENGLMFSSAENMPVTISNSKIGHVFKSGFVLEGIIKFVAENSELFLNNVGALQLDEKVHSTLLNNTILIQNGLLNDLNCEENDIEGNRIILVLNQQTSLAQSNENNAEILDVQDSVNSFLHPSCTKNNFILNLIEPRNLDTKQKIIETTSSTTLRPTTTTIETTVSTVPFPTTAPTDAGSPEAVFDSKYQFAVDKYLAYLIIGLLGFFFLTTFILAIVISCLKRKKRTQNSSVDISKTRRPSLMYMPGSMYDSDCTWPSSVPMPSATDTFLMKNYNDDDPNA